MLFIGHFGERNKKNKPLQNNRKSDSDYKKLIQSSIEKMSRKDYEGALEDINGALDYKPYLENLYLQRGKIKEALDDLAGAKSDYTKAIMLNENFDLAYLSRGMLKVKEKDYPGARNDINKAAELNSEIDGESILTNERRREINSSE